MKNILSLVLALWCIQAHAAISYVFAQTPMTFSNSPNTTAAFNPAAGDTIIVQGLAGQAAFPVNSATGTGTYSLGGAHLQDLDGDDISFWVNPSATAGSQTVTLTGTASHTIWSTAIDYRGVGSTAIRNITTAAAPGTGTGALAGAAIAVPTGSVLVVLAYQSTDYSAVTITATAGTNRVAHAGTGTDDYSWTLQEYAGGSTVTPAFTVSSGGDNYAVIEILLSPPTGVPGISLGYTNCNGSQTSGTSVASTSGTTQATGSTFAAIVTNKNAALPSLADNKGNTWVQAGQVNSFSVAMMTLYYCINCTGGSGHVVTASWSGAASASSICFAEFAGLGAGTLDANPTPIFDTSDTMSTAGAPLSTTTANELVINAMGTENAFDSTITDGGTGFSLAVSQPHSANGNNAAISWGIFPLSGSAVKDVFGHSVNDYVGAFGISIKQGSAPVSPASPGRLSTGVGLTGVGT